MQYIQLTNNCQLSPATASIATKTASLNGRPRRLQKIHEAIATMKTTDEIHAGTKSAMKTVRRPHRRVSNQTLLAHDVMLTATQRADRSHAEGDHTPRLSQTRMYHRRNHRDEATHSVRNAATATHTIHTMSTHAEMTVGATIAAT